MTVLNLQVGESADDAAQASFGGSMSLIGDPEKFGKARSSPNSAAGWRFPTVTGLGSALVNSCLLTLHAANTDTDTNLLGTFKLEKESSPTVFTSTAFDITARTLIETVTCRGNDEDFSDPWVNGNDITVDVAGDATSLTKVLQELVDLGFSPTALVLVWLNLGSVNTEYQFETFDGSPTLAAKLDIDFDVGGGPIVEGVGAIAAPVTVVGAGAVDLIGASGVDVTVTVVGAGDVGALLEGIGAIDAAATVVGAGTLDRGGQGEIDAAVTVVGAGEVTLGPGVTAINVTVTVTGRGELGGVLEATAAISVSATVVGAGSTFIGPEGEQAISTAVTVTGIGTVAIVGAGAISAAVTVVGLGESGPVLFTVFGYEVELDPDTMPEDHTKFWICVLSAPSGGTARVRMFNLTLGTEVSGTELTTTSATPTRLVSAAAITLPSGVHSYRAEYGGTAGNIHTMNSAKLRIFSLEPS